MLDVEELYATHTDRVYAYFAYRVSSPSDAEDLTSLAFERVVRFAGRFDPARGTAATWLFAICERVLIDHYRRHGRRDESSVETAGLEWAAPDDRPSVGLSPALQNALAGLGERERRVIGLRFGGDLSAREIGGLLGVSENNVHQILSRALRRLRADIGEVSQAR